MKGLTVSRDGQNTTIEDLRDADECDRCETALGAYYSVLVLIHYDPDDYQDGQDAIVVLLCPACAKHLHREAS